MASYFIGIDLGWKAVSPAPKSTGLCLMGDDGRIETLELATTDDDVLEFVGSIAADDVCLGIDAPLIVKNISGRRPCETLLSKMGQPAHSSNRTRLEKAPYFGIRGERLVEALKTRGFSLSTERESKDRRVIYEVYPAPAIKNMAVERKLPPYKKGPKHSRVPVLQKLMERLFSSDWIAGSVSEWFPELMNPNWEPTVAD